MNKPKPKGKTRANGQGTVYKSRDKYRWQFVIPGREGREPLRLSGVAETREEAEILLVQARADHSRGKLGGRPSTVTFKSYAETYFKRPRGWAETTLRRYTILAAYATDVFGERALSQIKPVDIRNMVTELSVRRSLSKRNPDQVIGLETVNTTLWLVRNIFQEAVVDQLISVNPTLEIKVPKPGRDELADRKEGHKVFDFEEAERFVKLGTLMWENGLTAHWPALYSMLSLGLRRGEVAGLRWGDVDFKRDLIHVRQSRNYMQQLTRPKTASSYRTIPLPGSLKTILLSLDQSGEAVFGFAGRYLDPNLFTNAMRIIERWSDPHHLEQNLAGVLAQGIEPSPELSEFISQHPKLTRLNPHGLRHTYATLSLRKGVPIEVVSRTLGHARISMTYDVYRHVLETEMKEKSIDLFGP